MNSEYVNFKKHETVEIKKSFLTSQLKLLDTFKHFKEYKRLRTDELLLKISLKEKVSRLKENVKNLDKMLPKAEHSSLNESFNEMSKRMTLEEEIDSIKKKLATLNEY